MAPRAAANRVYMSVEMTYTKSSKPIRILIVEDNPGDEALLLPAGMMPEMD